MSATRCPAPVHIVISEIVAADDGVERLCSAFKDRLHAVDSWPGFLGLEVLQSSTDAARFLMITRWESREAFRAYMKSDRHRASHARIPKDRPPRGVGVREFNRVAT